MEKPTAAQRDLQKFMAAHNRGIRAFAQGDMKTVRRTLQIKSAIQKRQQARIRAIVAGIGDAGGS